MILKTLTALYFAEINIYYSIVIYYNYTNKYLQTLSLVLSNNFVIPTSFHLINKIDKDKIYFIDYFISLGAHFFSSYYHLCDCEYTKYCEYLSYNTFQTLDFYFSYMMISMCIQHFLNYTSNSLSTKRLWILVSFLVQILTIWYDHFNIIYNISFSLLKLSYVSFYFYCYNKVNISKNYTILLIFSIFLALSGYFTNYLSYWITHSYFWHLFIFASSYFSYNLIE
jgi:hypothetical protein